MRELLSLPFLIAALVVPAGASAAPAGFVGMTAGDIFYNDDPTYRSSQLSEMRQANVRLLRHNFQWNDVEVSPGVYDWAYQDAYVEAVARKGIRLLGIIHDPPPFHEKKARGRGVAPPKSNTPITNFARALVNRYGPKGTFWRGSRAGLRRFAVRSWQVWNEPTLPVYWKPRPNARQYVKMVRAVSRAIHSRDRGAEVVSAGLPNSFLAGAVPLFRYIRQMYRAGARNAFDTLALNTYAKNAAELRAMLTEAREIMDRAGHRKGKIWITELGWADTGPNHRFVVGRRGQVKRINSSFRVIRQLRRPYKLRGLVWYQWRDQQRPAGETDEWGYHTGLLNLAGGRKPAFGAFKRMTRGLR